eukprot:4870815-Prorocentrum_lima.AAC.1
MTSSLVGSEMCIRDSRDRDAKTELLQQQLALAKENLNPASGYTAPTVSYTHLTLPTICSV